MPNLKNIFRDADIFVHYGGEERIALLPHCEFADGISTAWRILELIQRQSIAEFGSGRVTCSIGVANYTIDKPLTGDALIKQADDHLYQAKKQWP